MYKLTFVIIVVMTLTSCASIVSKSSSVFGVDSTPDGAEVEILDRNGHQVYQGQTPVTTRLKHSAGFFKPAVYHIKLSMNGYKTRVVTVDTHLNGWYFGNLLFGGLLGFLVIDPATGAMYKLNTKNVDESLVPENATGGVSAQPQRLQILALKDVPADLRSKLVRLPE